MSEKYYAVRQGRTPGIYRDWESTQAQTQGFSNPQFKKFTTLEDAQNFMNAKPDPTPSKTDHQEKTVNINDYDGVIYTDGGCRNHGNVKGGHVKNTDPAAWAFEIKTPQGHFEQSKAYRGFTNNQMEVAAVINALKQTKEFGAQDKKLLLVTDSKYVYDTVTQGRLDKWEQRDWNGVKNVPYWQATQKELKQFSNLDFHWTKGHAKNLGNNHVDELLNQSMDQLKPLDTSNKKDASDDLQP